VLPKDYKYYREYHLVITSVTISVTEKLHDISLSETNLQTLSIAILILHRNNTAN